MRQTPFPESPIPARRRFLAHSGAGLAGAGLGLASSVAAGALVFSSPVAAQPVDRRLNLINAHTGERLDIVYFTRGVYIDESLAAINHLMRDHRADEEREIDRVLLDDLARLYLSLDTEEPIRLLSGYRSPATNAKLRKRSKGVAKYSLHMEGKAADIHVPGIRTRDLQAAAIAMQAGGVGYYGRSGFVHVDTGAIRQWES